MVLLQSAKNLYKKYTQKYNILVLVLIHLYKNSNLFSSIFERTAVKRNDSKIFLFLNLQHSAVQFIRLIS